MTWTADSGEGTWKAVDISDLLRDNGNLLPTFGVLGESQSRSFLQDAYGMGLVHPAGDDGVLHLLRWRCTLGVLHPKSRPWVLEVASSELLSLLLVSSPQLEKSSCWLIPSNTVAILGPSFLRRGFSLKALFRDKTYCIQLSRVNRMHLILFCSVHCLQCEDFIFYWFYFVM